MFALNTLSLRNSLIYQSFVKYNLSYCCYTCIHTHTLFFLSHTKIVNTGQMYWRFNINEEINWFWGEIVIRYSQRFSQRLARLVCKTSHIHKINKNKNSEYTVTFIDCSLIHVHQLYIIEAVKLIIKSKSIDPRLFESSKHIMLPNCL